MKLPDGDGLSLVEWVQTNRPQLPIAVITAHGNVESAVRALKLGRFRLHLQTAPHLAALRKLISATLRLTESTAATAQVPGIRLLGNPPP